jgi:hypothetical protein
MLNNVNSFNNAKATNNNELLIKHNYLIDIMQQIIKVLQADIANGMSVDSNGKVVLSLSSSTTSGALSSTDWGTFNGKQDHSNELDAIAVLSDAPGLMKKTGDGTYSMLEGTAENDLILAGADLSWTVKSLAEVQSLIGATGGGGTGNWRFA